MNNFFKKMGAVLAALFFWQIAAMSIRSSILLVSPIQVVKKLSVLWLENAFWKTAAFSFCHILAGFLLAWLLGCLFAAAAARFSLVETLLWPWMAAIKSVPVVSFIVICLIWLSPVRLSDFISFLIVLPIVYSNMLAGLRSVDPSMLEMTRVFRVSPWKKMKCVILPHLKPYLLSACRVTCGMAWKAGIAAEVIGTPGGSIGQKMALAKMYLNTDDLLAWTVMIVAFSVINEKILIALLRKLPGKNI